MEELREKTKEFTGAAWQWLKVILLSFVIAALLRGFLFEPVYVEGQSMEKTLFSGQRLVIYKLGYYFMPPRKGDIIVLQVQQERSRYLEFLELIPFINSLVPDLAEIDYIKRVIAVPGDTISISQGSVYINGQMIYEPYVNGATIPGTPPVKVPPGKVFVMGDNRQDSRDSREIGCISYESIKGKAVLKIWPWGSFGALR